jgi:hypothetical protein
MGSQNYFPKFPDFQEILFERFPDYFVVVKVNNEVRYGRSLCKRAL